ncbi:hypothetical protein APHCR_0011 [Anaplasma phagocytophilum str. CR1007]|nr:hypothetical protein APHCR_0011 [Anaplasma phagocytophilum str. CR1007]
MRIVCFGYGFAPVLSVGERTHVGWFCVICNAIGRVGETLAGVSAFLQGVLLSYRVT